MRYLLLLVITLPFSLHAQDGVEEGITADLPEGHKIERVIGLINNHIFFATKNEYGEFIGFGCISSDGSGLKTQSFEATGDHEINFYILDDRFVIFKTKIDHLYAELEATYYDSDLNKISSKTIASHNIKSQRNAGGFNVVLSPSGKKLGILQVTPLPGDKPEALIVRVLDTDCNVLWEKEHETGYKKSINPFNSSVISDVGDFHIVKRIRNGMNYEFHRYSFYKSGALIKDGKLKLHGAFIADLSFETDTANNLVIAGFLTTSDYSRHEGYFVKRYDCNGNETTDVRKSIPEGVMAHFIGKKATKADAALEHVYIEDILFVEDKIYLCFEYIFSDSHKDKDDTYHHHNVHGPMAIMRIDTMGKYESFKGFEMKQVAWDRSYFFASFRAFQDNDVIVIYNNFDTDHKSHKISGTVTFKMMIESSQDFDLVLESGSSDFFASRSLLAKSNDGVIYSLRTNLERNKIKPVVMTF